ncbi:MAG: T9SS type A sorting domain-containing protein [Bacteroidetes bacterium]|nr:T9SS type A sorting domain-containing protein [Bacteroidota bacterium]
MKKFTINTVIIILFSMIGMMPAAFATKWVVLLQGFSFVPSNLPSVTVGDTIKWQWVNGFHTTTSTLIPAGASSWDKIINSSQPTYEYAVSVPGNYNYQCSFHFSLGMVGSFTVNPPLNTITGVLSYNNSGSTGLPNSTVKLLDGSGTILKTASTNSSGSYTLTQVPNGTYTLKASTQVLWGGVNATDALTILKSFVAISPLTNLRLKAADVDASNFVNSIDALATAKRFVGLINSFPAGDWYFQSVPVTVTGGVTSTVNFQGICFGDTDGSYSTFLFKTSPSIRVNYVAAREIRAGQDLDIPFISGQDLDISAISLDLVLPENTFEIEKVILPTDDGSLTYGVSSNSLKIAWYNINPIHISSGDPLVLIRVKTSEDLQPGKNIFINIQGNSELADAQAKPLNNINVFIPEYTSTLNHVTHTITQMAFTFSPSNLSGVITGDTIEWVWTGGIHTTTSTAIPSGAAGWDSPLTSSHTSFKYVPELNGEFDYECTIHAAMGMTGKFTVTDPVSGISTLPSIGKDNISLSPNPVTDESVVTIRSSSDKSLIIKVYDILGKEVQEKGISVTEGVNTTTLNFSDMEQGFYFVQLWDINKKIETQKVVKN